MITIYDFYELDEEINGGKVYSVSFERTTSEGYKDYKIEILVERELSIDLKEEITIWCKKYITEWNRETEEETEYKLTDIFEKETIEILQDEFLYELKKLKKEGI